jgi:hypothetical protein
MTHRSIRVLRGVALLAFIAGASFAVGSLSTGQAAAQSGDRAGMSDDMMKQMQAWQQHMELTEHHKQMHKSAGIWLVEGEFWSGPDGPSQTTHMTATISPIMGGLFMEETLSATMDMGGPMMPWMGRSILGYDNARDEHVFVWVDSTSSSVTTGYGTKNVSGELVFEYEMYDAMAGTMIERKNVIREQSDDRVVFTMYSRGDMGDDWWKNMELVYTRSR